MHREGGRTLLRARAVLDLIEKHTGMRYHYCTLLRWTGIAKHGDKNAPVCVHFANECLMAVFRDQKWNPLQSGEKGERAWYQDQIETVCANIKALQSDPTGTLLCGIRETWLLTGVPVSDLARPKVREELGLETILVPGKSSCQRREGASGKKTWMRQTGRLRFIRSSVERYRKTHENVPKVKKLPRRLMRPGHAAKVLAVDPATVRLWHKERILDGPVDSMVYWTTRGIRCGHPVTKRSVRAAQIVLQSVAGDVDNAGQLLRAMRDQDGGPVTVNAAKRAIGVLDSVGGAVAKACELIRTLPDDTTGPADNRSRCPKPPFLPSPFQKRCLDALKGKFLTATQLQQALGNVHREDLYARGIRPLMQAGVILNLRRPGAGYYRPDAPPPEIANFLEHPCNS